jgi:hypothetical protein
MNRSFNAALCPGNSPPEKPSPYILLPLRFGGLGQSRFRGEDIL